jgi:polyisoprenoid-binding protein YceI
MTHLETKHGDTLTPTTLPAPDVGRYDIDVSSSTVRARTRHLFGLARVRGIFAIRSGTIHVAEAPTDSRVYAEIETASFWSGNVKRDRSVRSRRLLNAENHPVITFMSQRVDGNALTGTLTVRDVTRPVSVLIAECVTSPGAFTASGTTRIDRTEFGVTAYRGTAGRYLDITVMVRCVHR